MVGPVGWGVDLGTSAAHSAVAADWLKYGALACLAAFQKLPSLDERGRRDGVDGLNRECWRRGELLTLGRRAVDVELLLRVALNCFGRLTRWRLSAHRVRRSARSPTSSVFVTRRRVTGCIRMRSTGEREGLTSDERERLSEPRIGLVGADARLSRWGVGRRGR